MSLRPGFKKIQAHQAWKSFQARPYINSQARWEINFEPGLKFIFKPGLKFIFRPGLTLIFRPGLKLIFRPSLNPIFRPGIKILSFQAPDRSLTSLHLAKKITKFKIQFSGPLGPIWSYDTTFLLEWTLWKNIVFPIWTKKGPYWMYY